jgi:hypothetical protein
LDFLLSSDNKPLGSSIEAFARVGMKLPRLAAEIPKDGFDGRLIWFDSQPQVCRPSKLAMNPVHLG